MLADVAKVLMTTPNVDDVGLVQNRSRVHPGTGWSVEARCCCRLGLDNHGGSEGVGVQVGIDAGLPRDLVTQTEDVLVDSRGYIYVTDKQWGLWILRYTGPDQPAPTDK